MFIRTMPHLFFCLHKITCLAHQHITAHVKYILTSYLPVNTGLDPHHDNNFYKYFLSSATNKLQNKQGKMAFLWPVHLSLLLQCQLLWNTLHVKVTQREREKERDYCFVQYNIACAMHIMKIKKLGFHVYKERPSKALLGKPDNLDNNCLWLSVIPTIWQVYVDF